MKSVQPRREDKYVNLNFPIVKVPIIKPNAKIKEESNTEIGNEQDWL